MTGSGSFGCVFVIIFLALITITSFIVLYQLFASFYCPKAQLVPTKSKSVNKAPQIGSNSSSNESSHSQTAQDIDESAESQPILNFFKRNTIAICIIFSITCTVCVMDHISLLSNRGRDVDNFLLLSLPLYFIGRILVSLIFIGRLHFTFKGSMFEYSKCTMNTLKGAWSTMVICALLSILLSIPSPWRSELLGMMIGVLFVLIDIALLFILLYLFVKKLCVLMVAGDKYFRSLMTKYLWLYTVCFISTFAVILVFVLQAISLGAFGANWFDGEDVAIFLSIDALSNSASLWLNLRSAENWYYVLCGWCDKRCGACCKYCADCNNAAEDAKMMKNAVISTDIRDNPPVKEATQITIESAYTGNQAIIL